MAPGVGALPPAAGNEDVSPDAVDVAEPLNRFLATLPPRRVLLAKVGLRVFDWLPFPWRFSRASLSSRQDFLASLEAAERPIWGELLLFLKVLAGLGYGNDATVRASIAESWSA